MMSLERDFIRFFSFMSLIFFIIQPISNFALCESDIEFARIAIELADEAFGSAYLSVLEAERAGGDVSELVVYFNNKVEYLKTAKKAFESGEYDRAVFLSEEALRVSEMIADDAIALKRVATYRGEIKFRNQLVLSLLYGSIVVLSGFFSWRLFKAYYLRRMSGSRSEVSLHEP